MSTHVREEIVDRLTEPVAVAEQDQGGSPDGGEWRAQLVGGIGDEAPQLPLGCLELGERGFAHGRGRFDLSEHSVEGEPEFAHLGALCESAGWPPGPVGHPGLLDSASRHWTLTKAKLPST